jgi:hypothetical protein
MSNTIEILTAKFENKEITREEFIAEMGKLAAKPAVSADNHNDAYNYVLEALNAHKQPDPRVLIDLLGLLLTKVESTTGYTPNHKTFERYNLTTLEEVLALVSVLKKPDVIFPTRKRSKMKYSYGDKTGLGINAYIFEYLFNATPDRQVVLDENDF